MTTIWNQIYGQFDGSTWIAALAALPVVLLVILIASGYINGRVGALFVLLAANVAAAIALCDPPVRSSILGGANSVRLLLVQNQKISIVLGFYFAAALMTFGYFLRHGRSDLSRRIIQVVAASGWPAYWLLFHRPAILLRSFVDTFLFSEQFKKFYGTFAILFVPYYVYGTWDACSGVGCSLVFMKALLWAPFWPAYLLASVISD